MKKMNVLQAPFVEEMVKTTKNLYRLGWDERNGGNISYLLKEEEILPFLNPTQVLRKIPMKFDATKLAGKYFIVTGSGKYFKNVCDAPSENLGILRVSENGQELELLWGLEDEAVPTSELPSHFMSHIARLAVDPENRIVMHNHASHLLAMSFTHELDEKVFTRTLWQMCTECLVVFPDGVGIIPWLVPGTNEIGVATAEKMKESRLVLWPQHGIYGTGRDMDEVFGLIETAETESWLFGRESIKTEKAMIKKAFCMQVYPDQHAEYQRRHEKLWPEMRQMLKEHGVIKYQIFLNTETSTLFGYLEIEDEARWEQIALTPINQKWWNYMEDIMETNPDCSPVTAELKKVFEL